MLKAIIFDCDGVIVNSEPHHLNAFRKVLSEEDIPLTDEEYYAHYLAMDDKGCFETVLSRYHRPATKDVVKRLILRKMALYRILSQEELILYPGVVEFVKNVGGKYRLAIASGAFRSEIKFALDKGGLRSAFPVIVSAQDVRNGKPHPESYLTALSRLNALPPSISPISPSEVVVIEDSIHGIEAAHAAGMKCLAVTTSYPREALVTLADRVVPSLLEVMPEDLEGLCALS